MVQVISLREYTTDLAVFHNQRAPDQEGNKEAQQQPGGVVNEKQILKGHDNIPLQSATTHL